MKKNTMRAPIVFGVAGAILVLVAVLLIATLSRVHGTPVAAGTATPLATQTPSASKSPTPSASPTPIPHETDGPLPSPPHPDPDAAFTRFVAPIAVNSCASGPNWPGVPPLVKVTWAATHAQSAWIVQGNDDAAVSGFMQIPVAGDQSRFQYPIVFDCDAASATYTITLVSADGKHVSRHWTITNSSPGR
jgi:hypothetical protein